MPRGHRTQFHMRNFHETRAGRCKSRQQSANASLIQIVTGRGLADTCEQSGRRSLNRAAHSCSEALGRYRVPARAGMQGIEGFMRTPGLGFPAALAAIALVLSATLAPACA